MIDWLPEFLDNAFSMCVALLYRILVVVICCVLLPVYGLAFFHPTLHLHFQMTDWASIGPILWRSVTLGIAVQWLINWVDYGWECKSITHLWSTGSPATNGDVFDFDHRIRWTIQPILRYCLPAICTWVELSLSKFHNSVGILPALVVWLAVCFASMITYLLGPQRYSDRRVRIAFGLLPILIAGLVGIQFPPF